MDYKKALECANYFSEDEWETAGTDTQYLLKFDEKTKRVVIAFYGSNSKEDWRANFSFWKRPYKDMDVTFFVHAGFLKRWKEARDVIMSRIEELNPEFITITGHSHGGAIALLCMEDCWFRFIKKREGEESCLKGRIECITFGAPRTLGLFNYKKIKERWNNTIEYFNGSDIITCIPPKYFLYRHPVKRTHIGEKYNLFKMLFKSDTYHPIWDYREVLEGLVKNE